MNYLPRTILGLNARGHIFSSALSGAEGKSIANSKLKMARLFAKVGIPTPAVYAMFKDPKDLLIYDWSGLPGSFALKPNKGLGGEGIIVVKKRSKETRDAWITTQKKKVTIEDLKLHIMDILEGAYSMRNSPDAAFIQEYVGRHKAFRKYSYRGTPDIRIIVFNKVPIMAMLRLPTKESKGRANLHQGAVGAGIDIATGITTRAIWHGKLIKYKPGTQKRKLHGIKIPQWTSILETAIRCSMASEIGYLGVDIVLHPEKGPMVLEINAQPGLSIQLANQEGLRKRLERVEDLKVRDAEHGVKIAKALFAGPFADRVKAEEGIKTIGVFEMVKVKDIRGKKHKILAKIDTGAWRTSIDANLAKDYGLLNKSNVLWQNKVRSALGTEKRPIISLRYYLKGRKIESVSSVANRARLKYKLIIGRKDLKDGFIIDSSREENYRSERQGR